MSEWEREAEREAEREGEQTMSQEQEAAAAAEEEEQRLSLSPAAHDARLARRIEQLEALITAYVTWAAPLETTVRSGETVPEAWWQQKRALQTRARSLLGEGAASERSGS